MSKKKKASDTQLHHFFATTAVSFGVGLTRTEAVTNAARRAGADLIKRQVKSSLGGVYCWTCRVAAPLDASYDIEYYKPVGVECSDPVQFRIVGANGTVRPID